jgi:OTU domain-containing protein 6
MEELQSRHRKEQRDLQSQITQKKKSATKKTRKGVNDECDRLQRELSERQQAEITKLTTGVDIIADGIDSVKPSDHEETPEAEQSQNLATNNGSIDESQMPTTTDSTGSTARTKKPNRQKARLARRAAEQEAQSAIAAEEAANQTDHRGNEREIMDAAFKKLGLREREIQPDGHCLYSAVATQLEDSKIGLGGRHPLSPATASRVDSVVSPTHDGYRAVRAVTADFIQAHISDFEPFMEEPAAKYTQKIRLTAEWGGQLELQAIARAYGVEINIVQGDGRIEKVECGDDGGEDGDKSVRQIWLAYYRHTYGLGEHYNALLKAS